MNPNEIYKELRKEQTALEYQIKKVEKLRKMYSSNNINKIDSELKEEIKELIEDAFQAGYEAGFAEAEGGLRTESCQQYIERKMKELDNEIK